MRWLRFPRVLAAVCCLYFVAMAALFGVMSTENTEFSATAAQTQGVVIRMVPKSPAGALVGQSRHRQPVAPTVQFSANGQTYDYTPARGQRHPTIKVGDTVTVLYDAENPAGTARIKREGSVSLPLICAGFSAAAVVLIVVLVRTRPRRRPQVRAGDAQPARSQPPAGSQDDSLDDHPGQDTVADGRAETTSR